MIAKKETFKKMVKKQLYEVSWNFIDHGSHSCFHSATPGTFSEIHFI